MKQELSEFAMLYSTGTEREINSYLAGKSRDTLIEMLLDLLRMYMTDKNSSTLREFITVAFAGFQHKDNKVGYNGFIEDGHSLGGTIKCEAKTRNIDTEEFEKYRRHQRKTRPAKLNGGGNFTDYSPARFQRDKKEKDLNILVSGFIDGKLIYIIRFPFNSPDFLEKLERKIQRWQAKLKGSESVKGQFLRSADFDYKDYIKSQGLRVVYLLNKVELAKYKQYISKGFYQFLEGCAK